MRSQVARVDRADGQFDFSYLRHHAGRHGILALQALAGSGLPTVAERARSALAELNRRELGALGRRDDGSRLRSRLEVYPRGSLLPEGLVEHLLAIFEKHRWQLACVDGGLPCAVLLIDLDGDGQEEAVVLGSGQATV